MFRCILHGSFLKHFDSINRVYDLFSQAGIEVIAPEHSKISNVINGFSFLENEEGKDPRLIELLYLRNLKRLGPNGFSYFVNPSGYVGKTTSYELGIAQATNVRSFFLSKLEDHPAFITKNSIWQPEDLVSYIQKHRKLPEPQVKPNEKSIHKLWQRLLVPGSIVAAGAVIEYQPRRSQEKQVLLVKTHQWGGKFSIVGEKLRQNEKLEEGLLRGVKEETGLVGSIDRHITTFDQIENSGYYKKGIQHIFVDSIVSVDSRKVVLNDEAEDYVWMPAKDALRELDIEPNAKHTLEVYTDTLLTR